MERADLHRRNDKNHPYQTLPLVRLFCRISKLTVAQIGRLAHLTPAATCTPPTLSQHAGVPEGTC